MIWGRTPSGWKMPSPSLSADVLRIAIDGDTGGKAVALGMRSRNGQVRATSIPNNGRAIRNITRETVCINAALCADEHSSYVGMPDYKYKSVNHSAKQFVDGMTHKNGIESV